MATLQRSSVYVTSPQTAPRRHAVVTGVSSPWQPAWRLASFAQIVGAPSHCLFPALGARPGVAAGHCHSSGDRRTNALWLANPHGGGPLRARELCVKSSVPWRYRGRRQRSSVLGVSALDATSLPLFIAQVEFVKEDVPRVVPMIVALGQGIYAFGPPAFGLIRELAPTVATSPSAGAAPYLHCRGGRPRRSHHQASCSRPPTASPPTGSRCRIGQNRTVQRQSIVRGAGAVGPSITNSNLC